jgi:hypothetical protein
MKNYKDYIISKGGKELGLTFYDIEQHFIKPSAYEKFEDYMRGQTVCGVDESLETTIVYTGDFERFIQGLPNND